ncbi:MAG: Smr/MutS family protein [Bacteroidales bacterium]
MIFPDSFENKIGFDRVRQMISDYCLCRLGKNRADQMAFDTAADSIEHELNLTEDIRKILQFEENFPQDNYIDSTVCLEKIRVPGTYAETGELNQLNKSLLTLKSLEHFFSKEEIREKYGTISREVSGLEYFPFIGKKLDNVLDGQGNIKDNASPVLKQIRLEIRQKQSSVTKRIRTILKSVRKEGLVEEDAEITIREGRPVIPLPAGNKRKLGGIVHDESSSGKTIFVEPEAIVELNNEIRELHYAERREIIKILIHVADEIRPHIDDLTEAFQSLGRIDFLRAKAKFALKINGKLPVINKKTGFQWKEAIHPLLYLSHKSEKKEVVPLNIHLSQKDRILLISGPNAGGKSVCLKTVGLLQYMLQCGNLVPMSENSEICLFNNIFIDIGDEQSLENDLSTYSSHLMNMKFFTKKAGRETLVLIDEFGTGTEPALGGAIAEAILEEINSCGTFGVITTHYANLKYYASDTPGIVNGAMLFDTQQMRPLFKLAIGEPGSSFAIDIARNIGLSEKILKNASDKLGKDHMDIEKHLRDITRDKKYWEEKRHRIRKVEKSLDTLYSKYSKELDDIQQERKKILAEARNEARDILKETNKQIERTIREIKESHARKDKTRKARENLEEYKKQVAAKNKSDSIDKKLEELQQAGLRLSEHSPEIEKALVNKAEKEIPVNSFVKKGDSVKMKGTDNIGEVLEVTGKSLLVAFGNMITSLDHSRVERAEKKDVPGKQVRPKTGNFEERRLRFKPEIDVRGLRGEEAVTKVRDFIDDALVIAVKKVRILHGKGNGILRQMIREYLSSNRIIGSIRDEHPDRGGPGITVVELDI